MRVAVSAHVRRFAVFATLLLLVSGIAVGVSATTPAPTEPRNETEPETPSSHQDPTNVTEAGDSQQVARYLSSQLASRLNASALAAGDEEYVEGRMLLGGDYDALLAQYAAVAEDGNAAQTAAQFNLTREQQLEILNRAEQLNQTAAAYQAAVENGDDDRARALARDIVANASELNASTAALNQQYANLESQTNLSFDTAQDSIATNQRRLTQAAGAIASREFSDTNVTVQLGQTNLSATTPTTASGRLTTANGTVVDNATIRVGIGSDTVTTQTDSNGTYTTSYQPLNVSTNASTLTATYVPASAAPFLSSTATTPITVTGQHTASISITNATTSAGFGDRVRVSGDVDLRSVENRSLARLPIVLQIGERELATTSTAPTGSYAINTILPETFAPRKHPVRVVLATEGRTVAPAVATTQLTVQSTPTELSIETTETETDAQNLTIAGTLTTAGGDPLADQTLQLQLGETPLETIQTDETGQYQTALDRSRIRNQDTRVLTVHFAASESNLEPSTAEQTLSLPVANQNRQLVFVGGALLLLLVGGTLVVRWQFTTQWTRIHKWLGWRPAEQEVPATPVETEPGHTAAADLSEDASSADDLSLRDRAQTALNSGDSDVAVQLAYAAFRTQTRGVVDRSQTHWEVYDRWCATDLPEASAVHQLTTAYEQAAFASESVSTEAAQAIIDSLPSLTDVSDT